MKDAIATMGMILPSDAGGKDSVHVACFSAICDKFLVPGQDIGLVSELDGTLTKRGGDFLVAAREDPIAIVDPFIRGGNVEPGKRFWAFVMPRTITGLVHHWTHPAFPAGDNSGIYVNPNARAEAEAYCKTWCKTHDSPTWERLKPIIEALCVEGKDRYNGASSVYDDEEYYTCFLGNDYLHLGGIDGHSDIPDEFWEMAEIAIGKKLKHKPKFFSCSC